jgi:sugar lactone lactonase YvrE
VVLAGTCLAAAGCAEPGVSGPGDAAPSAARSAPGAFADVIALPTGFSPEGITSGRGTTFFVGSIPSGAIVRGDARTGAVTTLVPAQAGRSAVGIAYDQRGDRIFVAGAFSGQAYVYDATTGATLAVYQLTAPGTLVNDVVVLRDAVCFTDSFRPVLYCLALGKGGSLPAPGAAAVTEIPLTGAYQFVPGDFNGNGIVATPNEKQLITVNSATGTLYRVDPATGVAAAIGGVSVPGGDGLLLEGRTLYVVQGFLNQITVIRLSPDLSSGTVQRVITQSTFGFPTTIAAVAGSLYTVNAHFDLAPPPAPAPGVAFEVVRVSAR